MGGGGERKFLTTENKVSLDVVVMVHVSVEYACFTTAAFHVCIVRVTFKDT